MSQPDRTGTTDSILSRRDALKVAGSVAELRLPYPTAGEYARAELIT